MNKICRKIFSRIFFLPVLFSLFTASPLWAKEYKDQKGDTYAGEILDEDDRFIYLDTGSGLVNLDKSKIVSVDGVPYAAPQASAPSAKKNKNAVSQTEASSTAAAAEGLSGKTYAVRIGAGGLTEQELSIYKNGLLAPERHNQLSGLDWGTEDPQIRKAIEDEIVFQEALKAGIHKQPPIKDSIWQLYQANQTLGDIHPQNFSETEMRAFYEKHKKDCMKPAEFIFNMLNLSGRDDAGTVHAAAKSDPQSVPGWQKTGWMKEGDSFYLPLSEAQQKNIYRLRKNQVSDLIQDGMGMKMIVWCVDYKPPVQKTFEEARELVRHLMIKEKEASNKAGFQAKVQTSAQGKSLNEAVFEEAVKAGVHRDRHIRDQIINTYLDKKKQSLGEIVLRVKENYEVEIP